MVCLSLCRLSVPFGFVFMLCIYALAAYFPMQSKLIHQRVSAGSFLGFRQGSLRFQDSQLLIRTIRKPSLLYPPKINKTLWENCSWVECPGAYGIDHQNKSTRRVALFITGQLTRLELRSKLLNMVQQNVDNNELYAVFFLRHGQSKSSNYKNRSPGPFDTTEWNNLTAMATHISDSFPNASTIHVNRTYTRRVLTRQEFFFVLTDGAGKIFLRVAFGLTRDEPMGSLLLNPSFKPRPKQAHKQLNHQDMFRNIRSAMIFLERIEYNIKTYMDFLFRLREDTFVLRPYRIQHFSSKSLFVSPRCWTAGGFTDVSFLVGRKVASRILRGLAEDYYFRLTSHYVNPEHYLKKLAIHYKSEVVTVNACEWPMIPVIFIKGFKGELMMKLRGNSRRSVLNACNTRGIEQCFWHEALEVVRGKAKPYLDEFTTWE